MLSRRLPAIWNLTPANLTRRQTIVRFQPPLRSKWYLQSTEPVKPVPIDFAVSDLTGRDLINFDHWTRQDILSLLWIALDLKSKEANAKLCQDASCTVFYEDILTKAGLVKGINNCGAIASSFHASHLPTTLNLELFASGLASASSVIFVEAPWSEQELEHLANGSSVPIINVRSKDSAPLLCLAECMTLFEYYGYLRRLVVTYLGPVDDPIARTYIQLLPKIGLHFRYSSDSQFPGDLWMKGVNFSNTNSFTTDLLQFESVEEAIFRAHVIITNARANIKLSPSDMQEAQLDWTFLHHDIHLGSSCSKQLLRSKEALIWKYVENVQWITQALVLATSLPYKPSISFPNFRGKD